MRNLVERSETVSWDHGGMAAGDRGAGIDQVTISCLRRLDLKAKIPTPNQQLYKSIRQNPPLEIDQGIPTH